MQPVPDNTPTVYLDHAATTPLDPRVAEAFAGGLRASRANPSSRHAPGVAARRSVESAREEAARLIGASPEEIYFTSGGTESDALAIVGLARTAARERGTRGAGHVVVSAVEHAAVREAAISLESEGVEVTWLGVDRYGLVDPQDLDDALREDTALAAVMWANNEVGTVQPVDRLAGVCRERGVPFHCDAVQAAGHLPVDVSDTPVSTLAFTGHKLHGPSGVGALYVRGGVEVEPLLRGGGQERGLRGGTENVAGIAAFGEACRLAREELEERADVERALRDRVIEAATGIEGVRLNGHPESRLPGNAHLSVEGADAEGLVLLCDALGYAIGNGAACSSADHKASTVLMAMGLSEAEAFSSVRISVGKDNTPDEIDGFLEAFSGAVARLREMSPLYAG